MALCAFAPAVGLINMQHFQWDARRCKGLGRCEEHAVLCAPLSSEGGRFRKQKCELSWEKLLIMVWKKFCVRLDCVWLQGAPVPLGTIAQTLLWRHRLLILPYFFNKISADRHSLANWSVVDHVPARGTDAPRSVWELGVTEWSRASPTPCTAFLQPWFLFFPRREGKKLSEQLYILGREGKHSLESGHILAGMCVVGVSCASSGSESSGFPHQCPGEMLRSAPLAPAEPLWGGR